jgi:phage terminase large subunit GpA-like protein
MTTALARWHPRAVVRDALTVPAPLSVSAWCEQRVVIPARQAIDRRDTPYQCARAPYQRGILDAYGRHDVTRITEMGPAQGGKSLPAYMMMLYTIDRDPGPLMYVMPDEKTARKNTRKRILPLIKSSVPEQLTGERDDESAICIGLRMMDVHIAWSNSPSMLASQPIYRGFLDEVDKYPGFSGKEASPLKLAEDRLKNYVGAKLIVCSTPTTRLGVVYGEYLQSNQQQFYVPCPACGRYQTLKFTQVKWPKEMRDPEQVRRRHLAIYECEFCRVQFDNEQKNGAVARGVWCPKGAAVSDKGVVVGDWPDSGHWGFWFNSLYACFPAVTISHCAAQFLEANNTKDRSKLMDFQNSWMADIWEEKVSEVTLDSVGKLRADYPPDRVPATAVYLTCGADVQLHEIWWSIRAWGPNEESWGLALGMIPGGSLDDFERDVLNMLIPWGATQYMPIGMTCMDSRYRTEEVYAFASKHLDRVRPTQGASEYTAPPFTVFAVDRNRYGRVAKGGLSYWRVNTNHYKDRLMRLQGQLGEGPVVLWHIPKSATDEYAQHLSSEQKVVQRDGKGRPHYVWAPKPGNPPNHWFDCEVYNVVAAEIAGVRGIPTGPPISLADWFKKGRR